MTGRYFSIQGFLLRIYNKPRVAAGVIVCVKAGGFS